MNSRKRVKLATQFYPPDRTPISHAVLPAARLKDGRALGETLEEYRDDFGRDYMDDLPAEKFPPLNSPWI